MCIQRGCFRSLGKMNDRWNASRIPWRTCRVSSVTFGDNTFGALLCRPPMLIRSIASINNHNQRVGACPEEERGHTNLFVTLFQQIWTHALVPSFLPSFLPSLCVSLTAARSVGRSVGRSGSSTALTVSSIKQKASKCRVVGCGK